MNTNNPNIALFIVLLTANMVGPQINASGQSEHGKRSVWLVDGLSFNGVTKFMQKHAPALGITDNIDGFRQVKWIQEENGSEHFRVQRTYSGLDVIGCEGWIHVGANGLTVYGGSEIPEIEVDVVPHIEMSAAIQTAVLTVRPRAGMPMSTNDPITAPINAQLIVTREDLDQGWEASNVHLAYAVDVAPLRGDLRIVYVDAHTGSVLRLEWFPTDCEDGTAETLYNGSRTIDTKWRGF